MHLFTILILSTGSCVLKQILCIQKCITNAGVEQSFEEAVCTKYNSIWLTSKNASLEAMKTYTLLLP